MLQEALEECRTQHNNDNQQLETKLDVVLAMMREGSTDEVDNDIVLLFYYSNVTGVITTVV